MVNNINEDEHGIRELPLRHWKDLHDQAGQLDGWLFRGEMADWPEGLATSLERACKAIDSTLDHASPRESELMRQFRRRFHHYTSHIPDESDDLEWLSWMQHYSAPTRLLDWTYSIYVAAYFALETEPKNDRRENWQKFRVVWAINPDWCRKNAEELAERGGIGNEDLKYFADQITEKDAAKFRRIFLRDQEPIRRKAILLVAPINPFRLNDRLSIQKGLFLCPGSVTKPFMDNLKALGGYKDRNNCRKLILFANEAKPLSPKEFREERLRALRELYHMNISHDTLFPGLEGFAKSLAVYHPVAWKND